jgi:transcriptional regulator with XRE-family HTH domain
MQLRRHYKLSQARLGELCGVSKAAVSQWETGVSMPEIKKLIELRSKLHFSFDWLITGEGGIDGSLDVMPQVERRRVERRQGYRRKKYRRQSDKARQYSLGIHIPDADFAGLPENLSARFE